MRAHREGARRDGNSGTPSVRSSLPSLQQNQYSNAGLMLDRYLAQQSASGGENEARDSLLRAVAGCKPPPFYRAAYQRWLQTVQAMPCTQSQELQVVSALIVGLGGEGVLETAITIHPQYGVPYIPGSALKGLCRHYAEQVVRGDMSPGGPDHRVLFGTTDDAGYTAFLDAPYVPGSAADDKPLMVDVITVHHPNYYTRAQHKPPWDFDDPTPVGFLSARGRYLVAVQGPTEEWAQVALRLLQHALADYGVGGKTSSGYGRLRPV